jgi:hypothetical protein
VCRLDKWLSEPHDPLVKWHYQPHVAGVAHMAVIRLRTRRDRGQETALARVREAILEAGPELPGDMTDRLVYLVDGALRARSGWSFVMIEPDLYDQVVEHLTQCSRRPLVAVRLWGKLFKLLPPDGNQVQATREELAAMVGCTPADVSRIMSDLEALGAVYRQREGRGVHYFVHPKLGTHLAGDARKRAQAEAPKLRLVEPA